MKSQVVILRDFDSKGKIRDWRGKKGMNLKMAKIYEIISDKIKPEYKRRGVHTRYKQVQRDIKDEEGNVMGVVVSKESSGLYDDKGKRVVNYEKRAKNMKFCGSFLEFAKISEDRKKLINANFCRVPLCPMCQWRKSMRIFFEVSKIMRTIEERYPDYVPVFLTLTVKNCLSKDLSLILDNMFDGWFELMRSSTLNPEVKSKKQSIVKGWFRALEVEYNDKKDTFHPHFHAIILVDKGYFKSEYYKRTDEWVQLWRKMAKLDYDPICDIRKTRNNKGKRKEVAEVAKYTYKDAQILHKKLSDNKKADVVKYLSGALHGRRLYAYGGDMKKIAAELKLKDIDKSDLVKVGEDNINPSLVKMIVRYSWNMGVSNYVLVRNADAENTEGVVAL